MILRIRCFLVGLIGMFSLQLAGCSMPHVMGLGTYYAVTDSSSGQIYYTDKIRREARGAVEFEDPASGAVISLASASVREIGEDEYRQNRPQ